ncbi:hypothetical protein [uncultured Bacteroides sp.]|uniref:hypothetical protein n=1 Tax=uncultured Bacteroides sp. TaxID=162156 RepID=UPI00261C5370|nr:hypothetical protein [uncultured Bacteroides sp.]
MPENVKSKKDTFRERFSKRYPDINMEDEESYYGAGNDLLDKYDGYEESAEKMRERISNSPIFAEMIVAAGKQDDFDPIVWMVQNKGLDLKAIAEDEQYAQKLADAHSSYLEKLAKQDEIEKQMSENMPASIETVRAKATEMGLTDEQTEEVIGKLYAVMDDLIVGKIDPSMFEMMAKGMNYDTAVTQAKEEGIAQGLNTKVNDTLRDISGKQERNGGRQSPVAPVKTKRKPRIPFVDEDEEGME